MDTILIKNGRIIDPDTHFDGIADIYLSEGKITRVAKKIEEKADREINAEGMWVMPGLIDLHVHLRDPGLTWKEDVTTGAKAAARGGITTIVAMPNTKPVCDSPDRIDYVMHKAEHTASIHVLQAGAVTEGQNGEKLADIRGMVEHGIPAISEDGKSVMNAELAREAMKICREENIPFLDHCEDRNLVQGGCVNEDAVSEKEGLPGITNSVEDVIIARDMILAHETGAHLHLCHCSTKGSYEMLKAAKEKGWDVSGEVCPHHFVLTSSDLEALRRGLAEGVFEAISTDHAPHTREEKEQPMEKAPFGIVGLETSVPLTITHLVKSGILTPMQMAERMSAGPAKILHLDQRGSLAEGKEADITIIDPDVSYKIDVRDFESRGKNTPFNGCEVTGRVEATICGGKIVYQKGRIYYD